MEVERSTVSSLTRSDDGDYIGEGLDAFDSKEDMGRTAWRLLQASFAQRDQSAVVSPRLLDLLSNLQDCWDYDPDDRFAKDFLSQIRLLPHYSPLKLCERCSTINIRDTISLSELQKTAESCDLCEMISQRLNQLGDSVDERQKICLLDSRSLCRICAAPGPQDVPSGIQTEFLALPESGGPIHFELLRAWLNDCNNNHKPSKCHPKSDVKPPTRVTLLDLENDKTSSPLCLCRPEDGERPDYVALSHCWGKLTKEQEQRFPFRTTQTNIGDRLQGFDKDILPQTFLDAITVTRELNKRYLWIDSLCIIQDDQKDWEEQSKQMSNIFANAYCTIAATSAEDSTKGFLRRQSIQREYVVVPESSHGPAHICPAIDDFHADVENGRLNKRAWVLQERALSRRTIHFTPTQTYWECGFGVRCETLTHMTSSKALFLGDPSFPDGLEPRPDQDKVELFQYLFTNYSRFGLTVPTDRPVAISGLEQRLAKAFDTKSRHGIFERYLHRSLLWQRSESTRMKRIICARNVPSWSWMAYNGPIEYMKAEFESVAWHRGVHLTDRGLMTRVKAFQRDCRLEQKDDGTCVIQDETGNDEKGWLKYDGADRTGVGTLRCAIIGRERNGSDVGRTYYILVVAPVFWEGSQMPQRFERVGLGSIPRRLISFEVEEDALIF